ncbi:MAG: hypothetical protein ABI565_13625 [Vicinamibacteria bacterium]
MIESKGAPISRAFERIEGPDHAADHLRGEAKGPFGCGHLQVNPPAGPKGAQHLDQCAAAADLDEIDRASRPERDPQIKVGRNVKTRFGATIDNNLVHRILL